MNIHGVTRSLAMVAHRALFGLKYNKEDTFDNESLIPILLAARCWYSLGAATPL